MAVSTPPPPPPPTPLGTSDTGPGSAWGSLRPPDPAPASPPAQVAVFATCVLAIGLVFGAFDALPHSILAAGALAVGIVVGLGTVAGSLVERVSGLAAGLLAALGTLLLMAVGASQGITIPPISAVLVGLFVMGMDWRLVTRLRGLTLVTGVFVLPAVGSEQGWAYPAAVAWFVVAIGALWLLENDRRAGLNRPVPVAQRYGPATPPHPLDVVRTIGIGLFVGLAAAFLIGNPSCSPHADTPTPPGSLGDPGFDPSFDPNIDPRYDPGVTPPAIDPPSGGRRAQPGEVPPEHRLDGSDQERRFDVDEKGNRSFRDPATGERFSVSNEGGRTIVRDQDGRQVAELDDSGVVAGDGTTAGSQRYRVDGEGRLYTETADGERLYVDPSGGRVVLRDEDGNVVAEGDRSSDHLVIRDPDGDVIVPDPDGDGRIPVPGGAVRDGTIGSGEGRTSRRDGDNTVTEGDGERRTYDTDAQGRDRVKVERPGEDDRTYVYDDSGPFTQVYEYDQDGELLRRYRYDPEGVIIDPPGDVGSQTGSDDTSVPDATTDQDQPADPAEQEESEVPWLAIIGGVAAVAAIVAAAYWYARRRAAAIERPWAEAQVRRIEQLGAAHGRPRGPAETVIDHSAALAAGAVPDERLVTIGRALSDALFGRAGISADARAWVETTLDEIVEAHPAPGLADRLRHRKPATTSAP